MRICFIRTLAFLIFVFALQHSSAPDARAASRAAAASAELKERLKQKVTLTFKGIQAVEAVKVLSEQSGIDMAISSGVSGTISLFLTDVEVGVALDILCQLTGNAYLIRDDIVRVINGADHIGETGEPFRSRHRLKSYPLSHLTAQDVIVSVNQLGLLTSTGKILSDASANKLVVWDTPESHSRLQHLIDSIDKPLSVERLPLSNRRAEDVVSSLHQLLGEQAKIEADKETNSIIVSGSPESIDEIKRYVAVKDEAGWLATEIIQLEHTTQDSLIPLVQPYLTEGVGRIEILGVGDRIAITDLPGNIPRLVEIIRELDVRPRQVLIELKIIQLSYSDDRSLGIDWEVLEEGLNDLAIQSSYSVLPRGSTGRVTSGTMITFGDLDDDGYKVIVDALSKYGTTDIVSLPRLLVASGHAASIHVGTSEPYVTVDTRESQGIITTFEKITMVDVGLKLDITPTIHPNDFVSMLIEPEVSSVTRFVSTGGGSSIPVVEKSKMHTRAHVKSGIHLILGGLMKTEKRTTETYVPVLGRIPILKYLFGSSTVSDVKTELIILMQPRIVSGDEPVDLSEGGEGDREVLEEPGE